ncbi:Aldo/keto reductase [Mycena amicta]|nr:Aldo/keto reductase [Mycena amicta]
MPFESKQLNDGTTMSAIVFGTGGVYKFGDVSGLVERALEAGFVSIDAGQLYRNEDSLGVALRSKLSGNENARANLYVATKLSPMSKGTPREALVESLSKLGLDYVDLYLIHVPPPTVEALDSVWREFQELKKEGLTRSIGVSNFAVNSFVNKSPPLPLLQRLFESEIKPAVNQIELHPYIYAAQREVVEWCLANGIVVQAYSSLTPMNKYPGGPVDKPLYAIAEKLAITPAQVLLGWVRAKGAVIITTSSDPQRLKEYLAVGDLPLLSAADVEALDAAGALGPPPPAEKSVPKTESKSQAPPEGKQAL